MPNEIITILMKRDELSLTEAKEIFRDMIDAVNEGDDPEEVLYEYNLEPDYVLDLIQACTYGD